MMNMNAVTKLSNDRTVLEAALIGLAEQQQAIDRKIAEVRQALVDGGRVNQTPEPTVAHKRHMSPEARKRIGDASRRRWAAIRRAKKRGR